MNTGPWEVGGDEVLNKFIISRKVRTDENVSAREWVMMPYSNRVRLFRNKERAEQYAKKLNKYNK